MYIECLSVRESDVCTVVCVKVNNIYVHVTKSKADLIHK